MLNISYDIFHVEYALIDAEEGSIWPMSTEETLKGYINNILRV